ncbi:unnamed protein product [Polarella glacialis]|uniref:Uncharacterized protein n=2 Tax=Polarella glacialis TaxID=89957 RepID=A0A813DKU6_POLGL|nr:unnamed protein product [Polarella glacialis]
MVVSPSGKPGEDDEYEDEFSEGEHHEDQNADHEDATTNHNKSQASAGTFEDDFEPDGDFEEDEDAATTNHNKSQASAGTFESYEDDVEEESASPASPIAKPQDGEHEEEESEEQEEKEQTYEEQNDEQGYSQEKDHEDQSDEPGYSQEKDHEDQNDEPGYSQEKDHEDQNDEPGYSQEKDHEDQNDEPGYSQEQEQEDQNDEPGYSEETEQDDQHDEPGYSQEPDHAEHNDQGSAPEQEQEKSYDGQGDPRDDEQEEQQDEQGDTQDEQGSGSYTQEDDHEGEANEEEGSPQLETSPRIGGREDPDDEHEEEEDFKAPAPQPKAAPPKAQAAAAEEQDDVWRDPDLDEAFRLFKAGDFVRVTELSKGVAQQAREATEQILKERPVETGNSRSSRRFDSRPDSGRSEKTEQADSWRIAMDLLATAHEDAGDAERAEALYLRMLAWREGADQFEAGHFGVAKHLFQQSSQYKSVEDATWFLQGLKPDDSHAAYQAVGLLALGEEVAAKAAVAVWTMALRPAQRERLTNCGALELVTKAVTFHDANLELQAAGCGALRLLCSRNACAARNRRVLIARLGGAEALTAALRLHKDVEVQREACGALAAAAAKHPAGARRILDCGGFKLCLEAIVETGDDAVGDAAVKALAALQCAAQAGSKSTDAQVENVEAVWEGKLRSEREAGLQFCDQKIREALEAGDRPVLQALLGAVSVFVQDSNVRHRCLALVDCVIACMQSYQGVDKIQVHSCNILWRLTVGHLARDECVSKIASCGGLGPIVQAMRDLPCNSELQCLAVGAVRNVAFGNDANKTLSVRAGAIPATITAMTRFPKDAKLQEQAIGALTSLCDTVGRAAVCARLGGVEGVVTALRRFGSEKTEGHVAELGCIILCMLCDDAQLRKQILQAGAMAVAKTLSKSGNSESQRWGSELIRGLTEG